MRSRQELLWLTNQYTYERRSQIVHSRGSIAVGCRDPCIRDKRITHAYTLLSTVQDTLATHSHIYACTCKYTYTHTHACAYTKRERTSEWRTSECCTNDNRHATHVHTRKAFFETYLILTKRIVLNHLESRTKLVDGPQSVRGCKYGLTSIE